MTSRAGRTTVPLLVVTGCVVVLTACVPPQRSAPATPSPAGPDVTEITAALEALEHVEDVELVAQQSSLGHGAYNVATLTVDAEADALCVLDRAIATLWFARPTDTNVTVEQGGTELTAEDLGMRFGNRPELLERYGEPPMWGRILPAEELPDCT